MTSVAVDPDLRQLLEMESWCTQRLGTGLCIFESRPRTWRGIREEWTVHYAHEITFSFRDPQQALLFSLTWL